MQDARQYVEFNHKVNGYITELDKCEHVINNPDNFTGAQVKAATSRKKEIEDYLTTGKKLLN